MKVNSILNNCDDHLIMVLVVVANKKKSTNQPNTIVPHPTSEINYDRPNTHTHRDFQSIQFKIQKLYIQRFHTITNPHGTQRECVCVCLPFHHHHKKKY